MNYNFSDYDLKIWRQNPHRNPITNRYIRSDAKNGIYQYLTKLWKEKHIIGSIKKVENINKNIQHIAKGGNADVKEVKADDKVQNSSNTKNNIAVTNSLKNHNSTKVNVIKKSNDQINNNSTDSSSYNSNDNKTDSLSQSQVQKINVIKTQHQNSTINNTGYKTDYSNSNTNKTDYSNINTKSITNNDASLLFNSKTSKELKQKQDNVTKHKKRKQVSKKTLLSKIKTTLKKTQQFIDLRIIYEPIGNGKLFKNEFIIRKFYDQESKYDTTTLSSFRYSFSITPQHSRLIVSNKESKMRDLRELNIDSLIDFAYALQQQSKNHKKPILLMRVVNSQDTTIINKIVNLQTLLFKTFN